jgi:hypothetical protein
MESLPNAGKPIRDLVLGDVLLRSVLGHEKAGDLFRPGIAEEFNLHVDLFQNFAGRAGT